MKSHAVRLLVGLISVCVGCSSRNTTSQLPASIQGPSSAVFQQCTSYSVTISGGTWASGSPVSLSVAAGSLYADLDGCLRGHTLTSLTPASSSTQLSFVYRGTALGSDTITVSSAQIHATSLPLQITTVPFNSGTGFDGTVNAMAVDTGNQYRVYASGDFTHYNGVAVPHLVRLLQDGTLDSSFNPGTGPNNHANSIKMLLDGTGRFYMGGNFTAYDGASVGYLVRVLPSGELDPSFNASPGFDHQVQRLAPLTDGTNRVYACGSFTTWNGEGASDLARVNADGSLDTTLAYTPVISGCLGLALAPEGNQSVYVAGNTSGGHPAIKVRVDGSLDPAFSSSGVGGNAPFGADSSIDGSNRVYFATGSGTTFDGNAESSRVLSVEENDTLDPGFTVGAVSTGIFYDATPTLQGLLYVAGNFTTLNGDTVNNVARLLPSGAVDTSFQMGTGFNASSYLAVLAGDGTDRVYYFGQFTTYNGVSTGALVRLNTDGSLDR